MPRTEEQFQEMRDKSRTKILQAALRLFSTHGVDATPMQKIAQEADIATGLVYNYFKSKDDLLEAIVRQAMSDIDAIFQSRALAGNRKPELIQVLDALFETIQVTRDSWRLLVRLFLQPGATAVAAKAVDKMWGVFMEAAVREFRQQGEKHPERKAQAFTALVHGAVLTSILSADKEGLKQVKQELVDVYHLK